jgi:hypothetical protein
MRVVLACSAASHAAGAGPYTKEILRLGARARADFERRARGDTGAGL